MNLVFNFVVLKAVFRVSTMKCARVHLQERLRPKSKSETPSLPMEKPRRYCQKKMVNPDHEEDPRWIDIYERFHCNSENDKANDALESDRANQDTEDLFLTVQTLQFQGDVEQPKKSRTSFKYKKIKEGAQHRMFVKQPVVDNDYSDDDRSSQLTSYYFDDYVKYLFVDKSRPTSGKSSIFLQGLSNKKENKATQIDAEPTGDGNKQSRKPESKGKSLFKKCVKQDIKDEIKCDDADMEGTQISYRKSGKRKSLTISRTQSPETVQVIRVDVVCNYSCTSAMSNYEDKKVTKNADPKDIEIETIDLKQPHFSNKYLLTNTIKPLDENLSGGAKVTLLCKTFTLTERSKKESNKLKINPEIKSNVRSVKKYLKRGVKLLE